MWVFGYGSLMWDGWERRFGCKESERATLLGFRRDFCKSSVRNWGTKEIPCPTLGLAADDQAECLGVAFRFDEAMQDQVLEYLANREGRSFFIEPMEVQLASEINQTAFVPINDISAPTFIGDWSTTERVSLVRLARGTDGTCFEYVEGLRNALSNLGIVDQAVEGFWAEVSAM